jgi:phosphoribosylformimino-5-aminoimidazole carboxamide ribotide isomerase
MNVYPAVDLCDGKVVKLDSKTHRAVEKTYGAPRDVARRWLRGGARHLHVIDLDGAFGRRRNWRSLMDLAHECHPLGAKFHVGGGFRDDVGLDFFLSRGGDPEEITHVRRAYDEFVRDTGSKLPYPAFWETLEGVIIGTRAITDFEWLKAAAGRYRDKLIVAVDGIGRRVVIEGWQKDAGVDVVEFMQKCADLPIRAFLYTNVDVEGRGKGVKWAPIEDIVVHSPKPVIFSGGITSIEEIRMFKSLGAMGVVLGSAIYTGRVDYGEAAEAVK